MKSLWFIVPAHGRHDLARICLAQLAEACATLTAGGVPASAVVIASDENLQIARELGLGTIERDNHQLGRKLNDGYQAAAKEGVDYIAPLGSDDWIDPAFILDGPMPGPDEMRCCRLSAMVSEDGTRLARLRIPYDGGDGVRILPTGLLRPFGYRPATEYAKRALDTSVWMRLKPKLVYHDLHPLQIVDFKTSANLNSYERVLEFTDAPESTDPFGDLDLIYPVWAVEQMRLHYDGLVVA